MEPLSIILGLAQFAPQLIKWVTGNDKASEVAAIAVDVAQKVTGAKDAAGAIKQLGLDPAAAAAFADKLQEREADLEKAYLADVANARSMQIAALQQDDVFAKRFVYYFSIGWSLFAMGWFCIVTFYAIPKDNVTTANLITGFLIGTAVASIFQFFLGSTKDSKNKDVTIQKLSNK